MRKATAAAAAIIVTMSVFLAGCAGIEMWGEEFSRAWKGVPATMMTFDENANMIDEVKGESFQITRDTKFDTTNSEGGSNADSQVLRISLGDNVISHVGSTLILAEDGLDVVDRAPQVSLENTEPGRPWLNTLRESVQNKWKGRGKTILIKSQSGVPLAVYAGDQVEIVGTDVPKSTWFRVDKKYLFVYRADYTVYDNDMLD